MKHILSFGGGVDSTTLLAIHFNRKKSADLLGVSLERLDEMFPVSLDAAVFSDPGAEFDSTYENVRHAQNKGNDFGLAVHNIHLTIKGERRTITQWLAHNGAVPLMPGGCHTCSVKFKGNVMKVWAEKLYPEDDITWYIGIEANETKRAKRFQGAKGERHTSRYPLIELGLTREACERLLKGLEWGVPVHKSSCVFCPWMTEEELRDMYFNHPEKWAMAKKVEHDFSVTSPRKYKAFIDGGSKVNAGGRALPGTWKYDSWNDKGARLFCRVKKGQKKRTIQEWEDKFSLKRNNMTKK